ncbi:hypothetical protein ACOSQ3_012225 [Xanthoceras sorbifolium]
MLAISDVNSAGFGKEFQINWSRWISWAEALLSKGLIQSPIESDQNPGSRFLLRQKLPAIPPCDATERTGAKKRSNLTADQQHYDNECHPGPGAKLARAAFAKIMKEPAPPTLSLRLVRLPSGVEKVIDSRCRAYGVDSI